MTLQVKGGALIKGAALAGLLALALTACVAASSTTARTTTSPVSRIEASASARCGKNDRSVSAQLGKTEWALCWRIESKTGLTLTRVSYTPPNGPAVVVLNQASVAQIDVPYDSGTSEHIDLPGFGHLTATIVPADCPNGKVLPTSANKHVLCAAIEDDGLRYAWSDYDFGTGNHRTTGQCLSLYTETPVNWYTYLNKWRLCDDGTITAMMGAAGKLSPTDFGDSHTGSEVGSGSTESTPANHYHNVFWRLDFALTASHEPVQIAQQDTTAAGLIRSTTFTPEQTEFDTQTAPDRTWRVLSPDLKNANGRPEGYEVDLHNDAPYRGAPDHAYTDYDLYATNYSACETLASNNEEPPCAQSVDKFVNGQRLDHPILWLQVGFHHLPREEDLPLMNEHWQGFTLTPRGLTATNGLANQ
jgi:primary-amine oxidase